MNDRLNKLYNELEYFLNHSPFVEDCTDEQNQVYSDMANLKVSIENLNKSNETVTIVETKEEK